MFFHLFHSSSFNQLNTFTLQLIYHQPFAKIAICTVDQRLILGAVGGVRFGYDIGEPALTQVANNGCAEPAVRKSVLALHQMYRNSKPVTAAEQVGDGVTLGF
jgi:hypothetical protein